MTNLTAALADRYAALALGHVTREFPNKLDHVMNEAEDARSPRVLHPIFYGSFDWHSCVHGYWMLSRLLRLFPEMARAKDIEQLFETAFTKKNVAGELAYLKRPLSAGFERPYGWAWLLMLAAEQKRSGSKWADMLAPLETAFVERFVGFLPKLTYAVRAGTHANTAFALALTAEYARVAKAQDLQALLSERARIWFGRDKAAMPWEPSGDDFLSPVLMEAECMRRLLPAQEFAEWFRHFLPKLAHGEPKVLFEPAAVSDRSDGKIAHLDGLNLSRAWCMRGLATAVAGDGREAVMEEAAKRHLAAALPHVSGDYMGEHWLASFAVLAMGPLE